MSKSKLPQHVDPSRERRTAIAPYNFVPLPERIVPAPSVDINQQVDASPLLVRQDTYFDTCYTGRIECDLITESPLYIRCPLTVQQFAQSENDKALDDARDYRQQAKNTPEFFYTTRAGEPVIPGSSLRGMLRALVEIVSYSAMMQVTDRKLFFRTMEPTTIGDAYRKRMIDHVRGGYISVRGREAVIEECLVYKIHRDLLAENWDDLYDGRGPNKRPKWSLQHRHVWVRVGNQPESMKFGRIEQLAWTQPIDPDWYRGQLVLTGDMQNKKHEFVFVRTTDPRQFSVSENILRRFLDEDQITLWQHRAFPKRKPQSRRQGGRLPEQETEPVFFILNEVYSDQVEFFGRAGMFRLPYENSPKALIRQVLPSNQIDIAQALFGHVPQEESDPFPLIASRVSISDGQLADTASLRWLAGNSDEAITPHILSSPKPTSFQHYLVQGHIANRPRADDGRDLAFYDSPANQTTLRGHKLYWHKGDMTRRDIEDDAVIASGNTAQTDTQHTYFKPVASGVRFHFTIHFDNLSAIELGALLWVLRLCTDLSSENRSYRLKLGMGKPLGLGSINVIPTNVYRTFRTDRYTSLFSEDGWSRGEQVLDLQAQHDCVNAFSQYVLQHIGEPGPLERVLRIQCLLALLSWRGAPSPNESRYLQVRRSISDPQGYRAPEGVTPDRQGNVNEYRYRPVLPTPLRVTGQDESESQPQRDTQVEPQNRPGVAPDAPAVAPSNVVETRTRGQNIQSPRAGQQGIIRGGDDRQFSYALEDIIGVAPATNQAVLFKPGKKKVSHGRDKKNVNWAYDVEIAPE